MSPPNSLKSHTFGHSDIKMTMRYAHPTPENKKKAVCVLGNIIQGRNSDLEKNSVVTDDLMAMENRNVNVNN